MNKAGFINTDLFCLASGPSLTKDDCELVASTGVKILAINNSWELPSRCDYVFAGDLKWWDAHAKDVSPNIQKITSSKRAAMKHGINFFPANGPFNSGMRALMWALNTGFKNIVLLGFDCSLRRGTHWHGLHKTNLGLSNPDQDKIKRWQIHFLNVYEHSLRLDSTIINCTRHTELECFKRMTLEEVLGIKKTEEKKPLKTKSDFKIKDLRESLIKKNCNKTCVKKKAKK